MSLEPLRVVAFTPRGVAGHAPQLDALLISLLPGPGGGPGGVPCRGAPAPDPRHAPDIPLSRTELGGWPVAHASAPILGEGRDAVEYMTKRIEAHRAHLLAPDRRVQICHTNTWTKAYRLPVRIRCCQRIAWLCLGDRRGLETTLRGCRQLGAWLRHGYGLVAKWTVEPWGREDQSWYARTDHGRLVLMRTLPLGSWLPDGLIGCREDYGAVVPPYWHSDRFCNTLTPV